MIYIYALLGGVSSGATIVTPGLGSVAITGFAPTIGTGWTALPGLGSVVITGQAPSVSSFGQALTFPGLGSVTISGFKPAITGVPFTPPLPPGAGDDSKPLHWRQRDDRLRPVFSPVLRRKVSDQPSGADEVESADDSDGGLYKDAEQRAAILAALDDEISALRRDQAARGLARMARDAGRRQAAEKVQRASEMARAHAAEAIRIGRRLAANRLLDEDE